MYHDASSAMKGINADDFHFIAIGFYDMRAKLNYPIPEIADMVEKSMEGSLVQVGGVNDESGSMLLLIYIQKDQFSYVSDVIYATKKPNYESTGNFVTFRLNFRGARLCFVFAISGGEFDFNVEEFPNILHGQSFKKQRSISSQQVQAFAYTSETRTKATMFLVPNHVGARVTCR